MKKIFTLLFALFATSGAIYAQSNGDEDEGVVRVHSALSRYTNYNMADIESITLRADKSWTSLGYCLYSEDFIGSVLYPSSGSVGDYCCEYYVEVQEKNDQPGLYRLVNPYHPDIYPYASKTTYDTEHNYYIEINACDPDGVYIDLQDVGLSWGEFGRIYVYSVAAFWVANGETLEEQKYYGETGSLKNGVITFPLEMLYLYLPEYNSNMYYYANRNGKFKVDLNDKSDRPGAKSKKASSAKNSDDAETCITQ